MTDKPNEWRDDEGRKLVVDDGIDGGSFFTLFEAGGALVGLDEGWARFLLRYLPGALGVEQPDKVVHGECDGYPVLREEFAENDDHLEALVLTSSGHDSVSVCQDSDEVVLSGSRIRAVGAALLRAADMVDAAIEAVRAKRAAMGKP